MSYRLSGTYTVTLDAIFEAAEKAREHAAEIEAEHTDVSLTLTDAATGEPVSLDPAASG